MKWQCRRDVECPSFVALRIGSTLTQHPLLTVEEEH